MAVLRFFQGGQFGKGLADLRKIKQGIVTKTILAAGRVQNDAFGGGAKRPQGLTVTGCGALVVFTAWLAKATAPLVTEMAVPVPESVMVAAVLKNPLFCITMLPD